MTGRKHILVSIPMRRFDIDDNYYSYEEFIELLAHQDHLPQEIKNKALQLYRNDLNKSVHFFVNAKTRKYDVSGTTLDGAICGDG